MRKLAQILGMAVLTGMLVFALAEPGSAPHRAEPAQKWMDAFQLIPAAVAQQPRETPPNIAPSPERVRAREENAWVGWVLLIAIPAVIIAWVVVRRRRMRRGGDE